MLESLGKNDDVIMISFHRIADDVGHFNDLLPKKKKKENNNNNNNISLSDYLGENNLS
jgi:hypothetical protein